MSRNRSATQEVFVSHANAALTPLARLRLARLIVDQGWPVARAAERYDVSWPTTKRCAERYAVMGQDGMGDRSSRPHRSPTRTPAPVVRKIVHLRWKQRLGPVATRLEWPPRRCTRCWSGAGSTRYPMWTGSAANRSAATNTPTLARCGTWTSRSSATSPTAAVGGTSVASRDPGTARPPPTSPATPGTTQARDRVGAHRPR